MNQKLFLRKVNILVPFSSVLLFKKMILFYGFYFPRQVENRDIGHSGIKTETVKNTLGISMPWREGSLKSLLTLIKCNDQKSNI